MQKYLVVGKGGIKECQAEKIDLDLIRGVVGTDAPSSYLEAVALQFIDPTIVVYLNESGRLDNLPVYAVFKETGENACGHLFICATSKTGLEVGLTDQQIEIVKNGLHLEPKGISTVPLVKPQFKICGFNSHEQFLRVTQRVDI